VDHAPPDLSASAHPDADPGGGDQQEAVADGGRPVTLSWALLLRRDGAVQWACLVTRRVLMERVPQARSACTPGGPKLIADPAITGGRFVLCSVGPTR